MAGPLYIGVDSGTQGVKVVVLDGRAGRAIAEATAPHDLVELDNGRREQDPARWFEALTSALSQALGKPGVDRRLVKAIGVSGQQHGFVPLDKAGRIIRPAKLWCDTETSAEAEELTAALGGPAKAVELIGNSIAVGFTASKVTWLKEHEPANYDRLDCILLPHDYLNFRLTGRKKAEYGDASGTAFFDVRSRTWSREVLLAMDSSGKLLDCLPELIEPDQPVGAIRPEIAEQFGLPEEVLVSCGGGDNMMAAIGSGAVAPGVVTASLGTSGTIFAAADQPVVDPAGELAAFCSSSGLWLPLVCTMNVTVSTELTRALLGCDLAGFNALAGSAPVGAEGVMLIPFFNGERTPALPRATASLTGLTGANFNQANVCRAAMEGPSLGLRYGLEVMIRQGVEPTEIRLVGGGAKSGLWRRIIANLFNRPVVCPVTGEAGALGAAVQAMFCHERAEGNNIELKELTDRCVRLDETSRATPDRTEAERYAQLYERYLKTVEIMTPLYQAD